ncbi:MAG: putative colanic acid biosynthesis acetyltransferase [Methylobacter sp.]|nr:putative colanic acid biosynthesis acetyltransferase [Methylobacter sp.]
MTIIKDNSGLHGPSFTLLNRIMRALWGLVYIILFRYTPRPMHRWRAFILRIFGAKIGNDCLIYPKAIIWAPWALEMGDFSCLANDVNCYNQANITLGEHAIVSQGAHLCAGTHDYNDPDFQLIAFPINIGKNSWICAEAFVGPGVTVNEGAVLGARAVTFKDLDSWKVYAGNPARMIKERIIKFATL